MATFMLGLRLFPAACLIPKGSERDSGITVHSVPTKAGEAPIPRTVLLVKVKKVQIDVTAMRYAHRQGISL